MHAVQGDLMVHLTPAEVNSRSGAGTAGIVNATKHSQQYVKGGILNYKLKPAKTAPATVLTKDDAWVQLVEQDEISGHHHKYFKCFVYVPTTQALQMLQKTPDHSWLLLVRDAALAEKREPPFTLSGDTGASRLFSLPVDVNVFKLGDAFWRCRLRVGMH